MAKARAGLHAEAVRDAGTLAAPLLTMQRDGSAPQAILVTPAELLRKTLEQRLHFLP